MRKKVTLLPSRKLTMALVMFMLGLSVPHRGGPDRQDKKFKWKNVNSARTVNPARRLIFLAGPMFCLSCRRLAKFGKEM